MPFLRTITAEPRTLPVVLTVAGSDSSGGAGIEADLKTFAAHGVYGASCITALTAQNTQGVSSIDVTSETMVRDILQQNMDDFLDNGQLKVVKTGMLTQPSVTVMADLVPRLAAKGVKMVVDPVMVSTSGAQLLSESTMELCVESIMRYADLVTPNYEEAVVLYKLVTGKEYGPVNSTQELVQFAQQLSKSLECSLLIKGGHIPWDKSNDRPSSDKGTKVILDVLVTPADCTVLESVAIESPNTHGTGCTLASSVAANLAKGHLVFDSVVIAIDFIHQGMAKMTKLGHGNGPLNHCLVPASVQDILVVPEETSETSVLDSFINHPEIQPVWEAYTRHPYLKLVATNSLPFQNFLYFLKQDYHYLISYAQIHALAASVAPDYRQTQAEAVIIAEVGQEIVRHKEKLSRRYGIDYDKHLDFDIALSPGKACQAYTEYLFEIGRRNDFTLIKVALAPCLHGYYEAGAYAKRIQTSELNRQAPALNQLSPKQADAYAEWIGDYTSQWYTQAHISGKKSLDALVSPSSPQWEEMVRVFKKVTQLEIAFWDEIVNHS